MIVFGEFVKFQSELAFLYMLFAILQTPFKCSQFTSILKAIVVFVSMLENRFVYKTLFSDTCIFVLNIFYS